MEEKTREILKNGEYGVLSMQDTEGGAYGVPMIYVWDRGNSIYLQCAPAGHMLECVKECNKVSFCVVGKTKVDLESMTYRHESTVMECEAHVSLHQSERMSALSMMVSKYAPNKKIEGMEMAEKSFHRIEIIRLDILKTDTKSNL